MVGPGAMFGMATAVESECFLKTAQETPEPSGWMKFGVIALASAVLGGMATAWWYRKTLIRLRQAEGAAPNPQFGISEEDAWDEI